MTTTTMPEKGMTAPTTVGIASVVVPGTNGRRGIAAAAAVGALGGDETAELFCLKSGNPPWQLLKAARIILC